ncbi:uncharacterized protein LOC133336890 [Musca vetustissima]|uniref:uncharacterized protein LOC133336890 n=1 Tax=Musca vetustissima TaxID=27455 RepID=UPI002AB74C68|nr:uncharacterized protein LOC133336890 [Musca vetustissima]
MPRSTAKSRQNVKESYSNAIQKAEHKPPINMAPKENTPSTRKRTSVKKEPPSATESIAESVYQGGSRKSERRRVARDIFLVFEEQPSTRRSRRSNKKQPKPKFGHLKVDEPIKPKTLLRDIKNEPKCYLGDNIVNTVHQQEEKEGIRKKIVNVANSQLKIWSSASSKKHCSVYSSINSIENSKLCQEAKQPLEDVFQVAKVNPIFLWAKQDNTRIIEVRCEDYDKRNRIRITKTSNGWRAMPRSDPSSSKVLKLYTTPLLKVKHENQIQEINNISQASTVITESASEDSKPVVVESELVKQSFIEDPIDVGIQVNGIDCPTKLPPKKSKKKKTKKGKRSFSCKKTKIKINVTSVEEAKSGICSITENNRNEPVENQNEGKVINDDLVKSVGTLLNNMPEDVCLDATKITEPFGENAKKSSLSSVEESCTVEHISYQNSPDDDYALHLCPKTGLFLRNIPQDDDIIEVMESNNNGNMLERKLIALDIKPNSADDNTESLEAKTRNLKDLLDDADLFQHCDDNANCDADLIDTLVKSSCENNLIQGNETNSKEMIDSLHNKNINAVGNNMVVVNEPPKCLSFNEAGEIEALNCELFHPNEEFIDSFVEKQSNTIINTGLSNNNDSPVTIVQAIPIQQSPLREAMSGINNDKIIQGDNGGVHMIEDSPKDLSYKKREEVCPQSESRSQCAVTSSSDIVKSQNLDESSGLASSSETLKNIILEQFMKINTISGHQKHSVDSVKLLDSPHRSSSYSKEKVSADVIETVVIEDSDSANEDNQADEDEEPIKKRLRTSKHPIGKVANDEFLTSKLVMIDKDPDPLTQLRLLIRNSQWKVPDPILVPKDRLSAVLASPAREIPLLITTRPELRLPEAFAYPEIIQNPNILVISMAQLEAILKNNVETEKTKATDLEGKSTSRMFSQDLEKKSKFVGEFIAQKKQTQLPSDILPPLYCNEEITSGKSSSKDLNTTNEGSAKCSHIDSSLSTDINAATMAVLNQMLWLPYFGQISQEFLKSIKVPTHFAQTGPSVPPKLNNSDMESRCHSNRNQIPKNAVSHDNQCFNEIFANTALSSMLKQGQTEEMNLFQKIVQQQMQNVINLAQVKNAISTDVNSSKTTVPTHAFTSEQNSRAERDLHNLSKDEVIHKKPTEIQPIKGKDLDNNINHTGDTTKTYNLRSSVASRLSSDYNQFSNYKRPNGDTKPRLTCKSLSNLIDPEHKQPPKLNSSSNLTIPCVLSVETNYHHINNDLEDKIAENSGPRVTCPPVIEDTLTKAIRKPSKENPKNKESVNEAIKQRSKTVEQVIVDNGSRSGESTSISNETNVPLWHPLFGSNSKPVSYNSPWQWTTVTAAGE